MGPISSDSPMSDQISYTIVVTVLEKRIRVSVTLVLELSLVSSQNKLRFDATSFG